MRVDLHNHTSRCNHATGTVDDYIKKAIELGIDIYGFTEHAPMDFDPKYRISFNEMVDYERDILDAKDRYRDDIKILLGYEVDFLNDPQYIEQKILDAKLDYLVDYLIGSVHFLDNWGFDNPEFIGKYQEKDINMIWEEYFATVSKMVKSGYFDIVGHLDLIKVFKFLPIIFTFFFITFPSGLVLYWFINNLFSIVQQFIVNAQFKNAKDARAVIKEEK